MQRIDENTYIDDTLVTCAEYQLFIDEMREQGKYYQPDHWKSYQFPEGQAREPILGVRHSDAVAFCEWLTKREPGGLRYHLPTLEKAAEYPLPSNINSALGYWAKGNTVYTLYTVFVDTPFAWVRSSHINPRTLDHVRARARVLDLIRARDRGLARKRVRDLASHLNLTPDQIRALDRARDLIHNSSLSLSAFDRYPYPNFARAFARDLARDLNLDRKLLRNLHRIYDFDHRNFFGPDIARVRTFAYVHALNSALDHARARSLVRALIRTLALDPDPLMDRNFDRDLDRALNLDLDHDREVAIELNHALDHYLLNRGQLDILSRASDFARNIALPIYIDLFTIEERIAGRSPAFEGIRLVKERIR